MCWHMLAVRAARSLLGLLAAVGCAAAWGGELFRGGQVLTPDPNAEKIELFDAIRNGRVEATLTAFNSKQARLQLVNKVGQPLTIMLPEAFGGRPILAQIGFGNPGLPNNNQQKLREHKAPQTLGLGVPGMNGGPGMFNVGNQRGGGLNQALNRPFFNLEPEKVGQINLRAVCLEYAKPSPKPRVPYEILPLDEISSKPGVAEMCRMLRDPDVDLQSLQAATWHVVNGVGWDRLGRSRYAAPLPQPDALFSARELRDGKELAERVLRQMEPSRKSGQTTSRTAGYNRGLGHFATRSSQEPWRQLTSNTE